MALYEFSEYVRNRAEALGISMAELARQTGISRQGLYGVLDGSSGQAKISTLVALATALQVHPVVIFRHLLHQMDFPKLSVPGTKYPFDGSGFVRDVTIADNSVVTTGHTFTKIWEIQNTGHVEWRKRQLVCVDQPASLPTIIDGIKLPNTSRGLLPRQPVIDIPTTLPGDTVLLSMKFTAPEYPCSVISYWKMVDSHGDLCFPDLEGLSCMVQVVSL